IAAVIVVVFVISFINSYRSNKPFAFYAILLNADTSGDHAVTAAAWDEAFMEYAVIDPEAYQVNIDTSVS
ncbi:hypothetical protein DK853_55450, partial [Klebsiella oxytoca]